MGPLVVLDWGFHTNDLPIVEARNKEGLEVWWFDGDRTAARQCFIERAINEGITGDLLQRYIKDFDDQIARIDEAWSKIQRVVGSRIIDVVRPDGNQMQESEIFELMFSMLSGGNK